MNIISTKYNTYNSLLYIWYILNFLIITRLPFVVIIPINEFSVSPSLRKTLKYKQVVKSLISRQSRPSCKHFKDYNTKVSNCPAHSCLYMPKHIYIIIYTYICLCIFLYFSLCICIYAIVYIFIVKVYSWNIFD